MAFKIGNTDIVKVYRGTEEVTSIFRGTEEVYSSAQPPVFTHAFQGLVDTSLAAISNISLTISNDTGTIDWGDGAVDSFLSGVEASHDYAVAGEYTITIDVDNNTVTEIELGNLINSILSWKEIIMQGENINRFRIGSGSSSNNPTNLTSFRFVGSAVVSNNTGFRNCTGLTTFITDDDGLTFSDSVDGFNNCTSLVSVSRINTAVGALMTNVFQNCSSLQTCGFFGGNESIDYSDTIIGVEAANEIMTNLDFGFGGKRITFPSTAQGADVTIATDKAWTVSGIT